MQSDIVQPDKAWLMNISIDMMELNEFFVMTTARTLTLVFLYLGYTDIRMHLRGADATTSIF